MTAWLGPVRWAAIRRICEGEPAVKTLVATAVGVSQGTIYRRAKKEGWRDHLVSQEGDGDDLDGAEPAPAGNAEWAGEEETLDPLDLLSRGSAFVSRQIARLIARAERRGGRLDKAEIDGLVALSRMMERWEALARDRARDNQKKSDAERADILRRINRRIVELAHEEAKRLALKIVQAG